MAKAKKQARRTAPVPARTAGDFYPPIRPYDSGFLRVSSVHEIYYEQSGNPDGKPVVFLHGGPGGGTDAKMRRFFNPKRYRIVLFDQRGCGKSRPTASLEDNTTWHLVADIEALRTHLGIERWQVFGGSWGSTLALAYSQKHPERCTELVLRGIFLLRRWELEWFYQDPGGAAALFPDLWEHYIEPLSEEERKDCMRAYYRRLTSEDRKTLLAAARSWSIWEGALSYIKMNQDAVKKYGDPEFAAAFARIECHYFVNGGWLERENQLLDDVHKIRHIPATIVQGRFDVVCPMRTAWALHKAWPEADFRVVPDSGHSAFEPGTARELIKATDRYSR
ncbi:MAG TPA: prolyl aminopeptidase [Steroidobacteraceae bacterium]|jgi:proline iminopeptidase|nr:prolyl aminopeptidase [Steroidobacteraceae bacterium]